MWRRLGDGVGIISVTVAFFVALPSCGSMSYPPRGSTPLAQAVVESEPLEVERLLKAGASADSADERGKTALLLATATDQFGIANLLVDHGANIWFSDRLGFTPAIYASFSRIEPTSAPGKELARFVQRLRAAGYPWPPPGPDEVVAARAGNRWPPQH